MPRGEGGQGGGLGERRRFDAPRSFRDDGGDEGARPERVAPIDRLENATRRERHGAARRGRSRSLSLAAAVALAGWCRPRAPRASADGAREAPRGQSAPNPIPRRSPPRHPHAPPPPCAVDVAVASCSRRLDSTRTCESAFPPFPLPPPRAAARLSRPSRRRRDDDLVEREVLAEPVVGAARVLPIVRADLLRAGARADLRLACGRDRVPPLLVRRVLQPRREHLEREHLVLELSVGRRRRRRRVARVGGSRRGASEARVWGRRGASSGTASRGGRTRRGGGKRAQTVGGTRRRR